MQAPSTVVPSAPSRLADVKAGFLVFLIALPLCLGIAMASGFPPVAGVLTAIVGGVVVSPMSGARLSIKGPAAGLIVIALGAVMELGEGDLSLGYRRALAVGVAAAVVQIVLALFRTATVGIAMSPSVVHGMLAAIGVIIISKQAHTVLGVVPESKETLELLTEIPHSIAHANPEIAILGGVSLLILFLWPLLRTAWAKAIPGPLVVLAIAVPLGLIFDLPHAHSYEFWNGHYDVGPEYLVKLPSSLVSALVFPDFSVLFGITSLKYVLMFALVGTIESTLSVIAIDAMDPAKKASNLNRDLLAVGVGNLIVGLIGGLPMISEIVRSKANIDSGARSSWANFSHGILLLVFVAAVPGLLQTIPLAALGAMLVYTGARLAAPSEFIHARQVGMDQLMLFTITLVVTLATDLLIGVGVGLAAKVVMHLARGAKLRDLFAASVDVTRDGELMHLRVRGAAAFTSLLAVRKAIGGLDESVHRIQLDLSDASLVDHTFLARIHGMADELPGTTLEVVGVDGMQVTSAHPHATRRRSN